MDASDPDFASQPFVNTDLPSMSIAVNRDVWLTV